MSPRTLMLLVLVAALPAIAQDAAPPGDGAEPAAPGAEAPDPGEAVEPEAGCPTGQLPLDEGCVALPSLVDVPGGTVRLGSEKGEPFRQKDEIARTVSLDGTLRIATTEVTRAQFRAVVGDAATGCPGGTDPDLPVACVSWHEAVAFCNALSELGGLDPAYVVEAGVVTWNREADGWRLPTEAEWELAARGGTSSVLAGGDLPEAVAWSRVDAEGTAHPVGRKRANGFGLHDMSGNVSEWVWDGYAKDPTKVEPAELDLLPERVQKGGSWRDGPGLLRVAARDLDRPEATDPSVGFRVVRGPALAVAAVEESGGTEAPPAEE